MATRITNYPGTNSWEASTPGYAKIYNTDDRWNCGSRFTIWTFMVNTPNGLLKTRGGYFDHTTGLLYYTKRYN